MKPDSGMARLFLADARRFLAKENAPRIIDCLDQLSEEEIWWRPNDASNSVGNLVLHLCGNVRQWITSSLGGAPNRRDRDREFAERGPIPRRALTALLRGTVREACAVLERLPHSSLARKHTIQGFRVTGLFAISHVVEHFSYHTGQIIYVTKLKRGKDLGFTHLPVVKPGKAAARAR